ncbi:MAG: glycoside-pentoside-hexuronide (GPH):cation symporter [Oscillospiraceae bacterium]|jgi:melibiose permease|nr:glycoside-pentoside-hexuronide (GPH):cation symporter [Oscillospiraceae bacterium]
MDKTTQRIDWASVLGYGVGAVGLDLSYGLFNSFLMNYFTDVLLINSVFIGLVAAFARVWDGINDPMMGTIVDNTRSKQGKFRPWIMLGTILNAVVLVALFANPGFSVDSQNPSMELWVYASVCYVLWGMSYTVADIPYWSMVPTFTNDPKARNIVAAIPRLFSGAGQLLIVVLTVRMVKMLGDGTESSQTGFMRWAAICGAIMILASLVTVFATRKMPRVYPNAPKEKITLKRAFSVIKSNDQLLVFMLTAILFNTGWYLTNGLGIYYFKWVLGDSDKMSLFGIAAGAGQAIGLVLLPVFSRCFGRNNVVKGAMGATFVAYIAMFISGQALQNLTLFLVFGAIGCMGIGAMFVAQTAMLADVVDYGEYKNGERTESVVFSMKSLLLKAAYAIQSLIIGAGLKIAHYDGALAAQPSDAKLGISVMMFAIPPLFVLGSFLVFRAKYKLDGARMDEVRAALTEGLSAKQISMES